MPKDQGLTPEIEIAKFKKKMLTKYNQHLYIYTLKSTSEKTTLEVFHHAAWTALIENHPEFKHLKSFRARTRLRNFILYMQVMCWLARQEGYSYHAISKSLDRTHATILMGVRQVENSMFTKDMSCKEAIVNVTKNIKDYVGTISEDTEEQDNTQSNSDPIWDEARRFLASNN